MSEFNKNPSPEEQKTQFFIKVLSSFLPNDLACSIFDMKGFKLGRENSIYMKERHYSKPEYVKNNDVLLIRNNVHDKSQASTKPKLNIQYINLEQSKFGRMLKKNGRLFSGVFFNNKSLKIKKYMEIIENNFGKITIFSKIRNAYILNANNPVDTLVKIDIMNLLLKKVNFKIKDFENALAGQSRFAKIEQKQAKNTFKLQMHLILLSKILQAILFAPIIFAVESVGLIPISFYFATKYVGLLLGRSLGMATGTLTVDGDNELKEKIERIAEIFLERVKTAGYRLSKLINIPFEIIYASMDLKNDIRAALSLYGDYIKQQNLNDLLVISEHREERKLLEDTPVRYVDRKKIENVNNMQQFHYSNIGFNSAKDTNTNKTRVISKKRPRQSSNERH